MSRTSEARRAAQRAADAPFDAWERREILPGMYEAALGVPPTPETAAITHAYVNSRYAVQVSDIRTELGLVYHLWIRRHDGAPVRSWPDLQRIKNEIAGLSSLAVEVFPPADELLDTANMYHLWVLPAGYRLPFGLARRRSSHGEPAPRGE